MEIWQAIVLGTVQGLTEFLPVSSSGHLIFLQRIFGIEGGMFIPLVLHLGTLVAVCAVFYKDILALFKKPFKTLGFLVLATIPAGLVGYFADDYIEEFINGGAYTGVLLFAFFTITATVLFVTETYAKDREKQLAEKRANASQSKAEFPQNGVKSPHGGTYNQNSENLSQASAEVITTDPYGSDDRSRKRADGSGAGNGGGSPDGASGYGICWRTVIPMGLAQAAAVLPGISRSGSTICAGTLAGGDREQIAKFSFLMSIPIILGGFAVDLLKGLMDHSVQQTFTAGGVQFGIAVALGFIFSAAVGLFAVKVMLKIIRKANYKWFSLYLALLGIACFALNFTGNLGSI